MARGNWTGTQKDSVPDRDDRMRIREHCLKIAEKIRPIGNYIYKVFYYTGIQVLRVTARLGRWGKRYLLQPVRFGFHRARIWLKRRLRTATAPLREMRYELLAGYREYTAARQTGGKASAGLWRCCGGILKKVGCTLLNYGCPVIAVLILVNTVLHYQQLDLVLVVEYGGNDIGYVQNEAEFEEAHKMMLERVISEDSEPVNMVAKFELKAVEQEEVESVDEITDRLVQASGGVLSEASGLYVDSEFVGAVQEGEELLAALQARLDAYKTGTPGEEVRFINNVQVKEGLYPVSALVELEDIVGQINSEVEGQQTYTVVAGDAPTLIAEKNGMPYADLKALNPSIEEQLQPGQEVLISRSSPFLGVKVVRRETYTEEIPFESRQIVDNNYNKGYTKIKQYGQKGLSEVEVLVTYVDGVEVTEERQVLSTTVVSEPVDEEIIVGGATPVQNLPATNVPNNSGYNFMWPVDGGYVSCHMGGYWGHTGMDIAANAGTAIRASLSGTVVAVKNQVYGYGRHIIIDHGNGVQTLYAHCSALYVSVGQQVSQGDLIAAVGRTGRATGNHCHFEVRLNNVPVNPARYVGTVCPR